MKLSWWSMHVEIVFTINERWSLKLLMEKRRASKICNLNMNYCAIPPIPTTLLMMVIFITTGAATFVATVSGAFSSYSDGGSSSCRVGLGYLGGGKSLVGGSFSFGKLSKGVLKLRANVGDALFSFDDLEMCTKIYTIIRNV